MESENEEERESKRERAEAKGRQRKNMMKFTRERRKESGRVVSAEMGEIMRGEARVNVVRAQDR